jgi:hypothetical protein
MEIRFTQCITECAFGSNMPVCVARVNYKEILPDTVQNRKSCFRIRIWTVQDLSILNRIAPEEVEVAAKTIWPNHLLAKTISEETVDIIMKTHKRKFSFFTGKTSRGLVGGLFYLLGYKYDAVKNQKELADRLGTSDVTIRTSYRSWLEEFPDLFQDIIGKLAQDQNLRWYVIMDFRKKVSQ